MLSSLCTLPEAERHLAAALQAPQIKSVVSLLAASCSGLREAYIMHRLSAFAIACRSWKIGKKGELEPGRAREKAHKDRVTALLARAGFLYSASYDGSVKMWDADTMELVQAIPRAHEGARVNCAAIGADGNLYTGGDDKVRQISRAESLFLCKQGVLHHFPPGHVAGLWRSSRANSCSAN